MGCGTISTQNEESVGGTCQRHNLPDSLHAPKYRIVEIVWLEMLEKNLVYTWSTGTTLI